jgi:hypothetical protein
MEQKRERELLRELDKLAFIASGVIIAVLIASYFVVASNTELLPIVREFIQGIILNLIPIFLLFVVSYALFRRIQTIKSEHETDELAKRIASEIKAPDSDESGHTSPPFLATLDLLVQNQATKEVYVLDRFGLRRSIPDEDTVLYFLQALGYEHNELSQMPSEMLKPTGPEVTAIRRWSRPRTKEDELSYEAQVSLKLFKRRIRTDDGQKILSFYIRNNGEYNIKINSATLSLDSRAPLNENDISSRNNPISRGLTNCKLLFNGETGSRELSAQEESRLDLFITRNLTAEEAATIETVSLGYIVVAALFRETGVSFHLQC